METAMHFKMGSNFNIDKDGIIHDLVIGGAYTTYLGEFQTDKHGIVLLNDKGNPKKLGRPMTNNIDCEGMPFKTLCKFALDRIWVKARIWQKELPWDELKKTRTMPAQPAVGDKPAKPADKPVPWNEMVRDKSYVPPPKPMTAEEHVMALLAKGYSVEEIAAMASKKETNA
jgi:hypothetical protein